MTTHTNTRNWSTLSDTTKRQYVRRLTTAYREQGKEPPKDMTAATRRYYQSGKSLKDLRGHSTTPERPQRASAKDEEFGKYFSRLFARKDGITFLSTDGVVTLWGVSREQRTTIGRYDNALKTYLRRGRSEIPSRFRESGKLSDYQGKTVSGYEDGQREMVTVEFETRPKRIDYVAGPGEFCCSECG